MSCTFRLISSMGTEEVTFLGSESPNTSHRIFGMGLEVFGGRLFLRHSMDNFMKTFLPQAIVTQINTIPGWLGLSWFSAIPSRSNILPLDPFQRYE